MLTEKIFKTITNICGTKYVELEEVEKYLEQQVKFDTYFKQLQEATEQLGKSFVEVKINTDNLRDSLGNIKGAEKGA